MLDTSETLAARGRGVVGEFIGRDEAVDRGVLRGLEVLADSEEIDIGRAQVVHHLQHLDQLSPRPAMMPDLVKMVGSSAIWSSSRSEWK